MNRGVMPFGGIIQLGERLLFHGDDGDVVTQRAGGVENEKWKPAIAGN